MVKQTFSQAYKAIPPLVSRIIPRLATNHVGELVATRDALVRSLGAVGLDLHDLAAVCKASPMSAATHTQHRSSPMSSGVPSFGDMARACRDLDCGRLTPRERAFVLDMCAKGFSYRPSPKQSSWLTGIFERFCTRAAA